MAGAVCLQSISDDISSCVQHASLPCRFFVAIVTPDERVLLD